MSAAGSEVAARAKPRVRFWMVLFLLTPLVLVAVTLLAYETNGPNEPKVLPRSKPAGWQAVTDAYFGYAVPPGWSEQAEWTDQDSDVFYGTPAAFVAETLAVTKNPPTAASHPPASFAAFGVDDPVAVTVRGTPRPIAVPGAAAAWEVRIIRPGGFVGTALDVWQPSTTTQLWLLIHASGQVTHSVVASLSAG